MAITFPDHFVLHLSYHLLFVSTGQHLWAVHVLLQLRSSTVELGVECYNFPYIKCV
jgi:hypothetical protein